MTISIGDDQRNIEPRDDRPRSEGGTLIDADFDDRAGRTAWQSGVPADRDAARTSGERSVKWSAE
ncbi:MAG: hypothetical protein WD066_18915 [Planctomycetaceae bacterium]